MTVRVQTEDFDMAAELTSMRLAGQGVGAVVSFIGQVRDMNDGDDIQTLTLEHYPGMTEKALEAIETEAKSRWDIIDSLIIHRVGTLKPQDQIVLVAISGAHRGEAFKACEFIMDFLKIWIGNDAIARIFFPHFIFIEKMSGKRGNKKPY